MYEKEVLDNGLTIIGEEIPHVRSVSLGIWVGAGVSSELPQVNGISHFIEHMLFKGTRKRSALDIAEALDEIGGRLNAYTAKEYTLYYTVVLDSHIYRAIDVLTDIFTNSTCKNSDIRMEKKVVLEEIKMYQDTPDELIHDIFAENLWRGHIMGMPILGNAEAVEQLNKKNIADYMERFYVPDNTIVSMAGNFSFGDMIEELTPRFSSLQPNRQTNVYKRPESSSQVCLLKKDTEQVHVCLGANGVPFGDPQRYVLTLLNSILGGSMSSRLFQEIRERRGLAYNIYSYNSFYRNSGFFAIYFGTSQKNVMNVLKLIMDELHRIQENGVTDAELKRAKEHTKGSLVLGLENTGSRMTWNAKNYYYTGKFVTVEDIFATINEITPEDVRDAARNILAKNNLCLTAIGPLRSESKLREVLA